MGKKLRGRPVGKVWSGPVLKSHEIKRVLKLAKIRARMAARSEVALMFSLYLGLRAKEIASLCWGDVYDKDGKVRELLRLQAAYTKGAKTRDVYLTSPQLKAVLVEYEKQYSWWRAPLAPLFRSQKGGNMTAGSMARFLKSLYVDAGIPEASSHTGRRTFITALAERGIDLKAIATLAGHSNIRTTALYVDANPLKLSRILSDVSW